MFHKPEITNLSFTFAVCAVADTGLTRADKDGGRDSKLDKDLAM